jgi:hypothetical protein
MSSLVGFERRHVKLVHLAAFAATQPGCFPNHVHRADAECDWMRGGAFFQMCLGRSLIVYFCLIFDRVHGRYAQGERTQGQAMEHVAGGAPEHDAVRQMQRFQVKAEGMDGEALLDECATFENLRHGRMVKKASGFVLASLPSCDVPKNSTPRMFVRCGLAGRPF